MRNHLFKRRFSQEKKIKKKLRSEKLSFQETISTKKNIHARNSHLKEKKKNQMGNRLFKRQQKREIV